MKKTVVLGAILSLVMTTSAFATGKNHPPKDPPKTPTPPSYSNHNNASANANANANAAAVGVGYANATGGAVNHSGNSNVKNNVSNVNNVNNNVKNHNTNNNANVQGQQQGQQQGQHQSNNLSNVGNTSVGDTTSSSNSSASADGAGAGAGANTGNDNGNNSNNTSINFEARKIPVSTAYAPGLTSGIDTCLGSASGGVQTGILGLSFGTTKRDKNCERIKNTHLIAEFNVLAGCAYMLKNVPGAADAFKEVGASCLPPPVVETAPVAPAAPEVIFIETPPKKIGQ